MNATRALRLIAGMLILSSCVIAQPPRSEKGDKRPGGPPGGPPVPGTILPDPLQERLQLTSEQKLQIAELQKTTTEKLNRILTAEQRARLQSLKNRRPGGPVPETADRPAAAREPGTPAQVVKESAGGIQWFATLESGIEEAQRTNRPILLVSGTPHCAGVSGMW